MKNKQKKLIIGSILLVLIISLGFYFFVIEESNMTRVDYQYTWYNSYSIDSSNKKVTFSQPCSGDNFNCANRYGILWSKQVLNTENNDIPAYFFDINNIKSFYYEGAECYAEGKTVELVEGNIASSDKISKYETPYKIKGKARILVNPVSPSTDNPAEELICDLSQGTDGSLDNFYQNLPKTFTRSTGQIGYTSSATISGIVVFDFNPKTYVTYYRFANNACSIVNILESEKTINDYLILADCEEKIDDPTACTTEAKLCSDGSYVSRVPPTCEFAKCPDGNDGEELTGFRLWLKLIIDWIKQLFGII